MAGEPQEHTETVEPDDGFTTEERAQFADMQKAETAPAEIDHGETTQTETVAETTTAEPKDGVVAAGEHDDDDDEPAPVAGETKAPPRRVKYARFKAAEDEAKALRDQLTERGKMQAKLEERLEIINAALTPKQQAAETVDEDPEPDPDVDVFEHNKWLKREMVRQNERNTAAINEIRESRQTEATQSAAQRSYEDDASAFIQREPNFIPAYQFLMANRISELALYYFDKDMTEPNATLSPQELNRIRQTVSNEESQLRDMALKDGKSPAQRMFALAKARGYRPAPPAANGNGAAKPNGETAPGNLAVAAAAVEKGKPASVSEEIARVKRGVEASTSLSQGGGAPAMALTPEKLANMPQDEFDALMDTLSPAEVKRAMGG